MEKEREKVILELDEYIASCKSRLGAILSTLGWNEEDTLRENPCVKSAPDEEKYDKDDPPLPESFDCMHSIVVGEDQLKMILKTDNVSIPKKFSDIQLNFTKEQKREIYDYVIFNTGKISEPELKVSVSNENQPNHDMTFAEIVAKAKKKDKKLKRKYRTSKPTHIEEVRNLVHLQMQALAQYFNPDPTEEDKDFRERDKDLREGNKDFRERRSRDGYRRRSRSRRRERRLSERSRGSRSRWRVDRTKSRSRSRSWNRDRTDRTKRSRSHNRDGGSSSRDRRKRDRLSTYQSQSPSASHSKSKHKSSKKSKKHTKSHSTQRHKSSKSKKSHKKDKRKTEATSATE